MKDRKFIYYQKYGFEVTKYNPIFRNEKGWFSLKNEWTDYSDIGKIDDDGLLTREKYLEIEKRYIDSVKYLIEISGKNSIIFRRIEAYLDKSDFEKDDIELYPLYRYIKGKRKVKIIKSKVELLIKLILRNYIWGIIEISKNKIDVEFGWDYYMSFMMLDLELALKAKRKVIEIGQFIGRTVEDNLFE